MSENSFRVALLNNLNTNITNPAKKSPRNGKLKRRRGLKSLQPSAKDDKQLVGNRRENFFTPKKNQKRKLEGDNNDGTPTKSARIQRKLASEVKIFQDPDKENEIEDKEAYELMVQETIPEKYWEEIAEQRREALADALEENEKLHLQIDDLKEENRRLSAVADQAEYFASVVKMLTEDKDEDEKVENTSEAEEESKDKDDDVVFDGKDAENDKDNICNDPENRTSDDEGEDL